MIKKISRPKQVNNQDKQAPKTIQELMQRYDLDNKGVCDYLDYLIEYLIQQKQEIEDNKVSKNGDTMTGVLSNTTAFQIPKNYSQGYGLTNSDGVSIIRDYGNQNVTVDATGKDLYLGFENTQNINILRDKYLITENALILNNGRFLDGTDYNGNQMHLIRAYNDEVSPGQGTKGMTLYAKSPIKANIGGKTYTLATKEQNILWQGALYMTASHTANLSQKISEQNNGIVLLFQPYRNGSPQPWGWYTHFFPKGIIQFMGEGYGQTLTIPDSDYGIQAGKYIYFYDDKLVGNDANIAVKNIFGTNIDNKNVVLTAVIGV